MSRLNYLFVATLLLLMGNATFAPAKPILKSLDVWGDTTSGVVQTNCVEKLSDGKFLLGGIFGSELGFTPIIEVTPGEPEPHRFSEGEAPYITTKLVNFPEEVVVACGWVVSQVGVWIAGYDGNREPLWSHFYENGSSNSTLIKTLDGDILFAYGFSGGRINNTKLMWLSPAGDTIRTREYANLYPHKIFETPDGFELLSGSNEETGMLRISTEGDSLGFVSFQSSNIDLYKMTRLMDGSYVYFDKVEDPETHYTRASLLFFDSNGDSLQRKTYSLNYWSSFWGVLEEDHETLTLYGVSTQIDDPHSRIFLLHVDASGDSLWYMDFRIHGEGIEDPIILHDAIKQSDGCYALTGDCFSQRRYWLAVTTEDTLSAPEELQPVTTTLSPPFPNPFNSSTTISYDVACPGFVRLGVYDAGGRLVGRVKEGYAGAGKYSAVWNGGEAGSGTYFLKLEAGKTTLSKPIVFVR